MLRKLLTIVAACCFFAGVTGCAENEHKMTDKRESRTESSPEPVSPGEEVVE